MSISVVVAAVSMAVLGVVIVVELGSTHSPAQAKHRANLTSVYFGYPTDDEPTSRDRDSEERLLGNNSRCFTLLY